MNEKDKALELVKYFFSKIIRDKKKIIAIPLADAKEYALRMVDEVLKQQPYDVYTIEQCDNVNRYWDNVKKRDRLSLATPTVAYNVIRLCVCCGQK